MTMGWEGERGGGEYDGECLFEDDCEDDEYDNNDEYDGTEDGKGHAGERMMGENPTMTVATSSAGHPLVVWGIGHQSLAPMPPPPSSTMMTTKIAAVVGGHRARPLRSVLSCRMLLVIVDVADRG
jgi:hypothetical protein